jgi:ABC-type transporter MlaC component
MKAKWQAILACCAAIILCFATAPASEAASGKDTVEKLVSVFKAWNEGSSEKAVFSQVSQYINYEVLGERALGAAEWSRLKAPQRSAFVDALRSLVEQRYYPRWHKLFGKGSMAYGNEAAKGGDIVVSTTLTVGKKDQSVAWRLENKSGTPRVVSLDVDEKDLLETLHNRITPRIKKMGFDDFVSWLKNKAAREAT